MKRFLAIVDPKCIESHPERDMFASGAQGTSCAFETWSYTVRPLHHKSRVIVFNELTKVKVRITIVVGWLGPSAHALSVTSFLHSSACDSTCICTRKLSIVAVLRSASVLVSSLHVQTGLVVTDMAAGFMCMRAWLLNHAESTIVCNKDTKCPTFPTIVGKFRQ